MLAELRDTSDIHPYLDEVTDWPVDRLEELGHALGALPADKYWTFRNLEDHVLRLLTLRQDDDGAAAAVRIATWWLPKPALRRVAEYLASAQRDRVLVSLLAGMPDGAVGTELGACLLHEMILRGKSVTAVADLWATRLAGHPLGELPLHSLPGEAGVPLPYLGYDSQRFTMLSGPRRTDPLTLAGTVPAVTREPAPEDVTATVKTWLTRSNGKAEAAVFTLAAPLAPDEVGVRTLYSLGLECLAGNGLALHRADLNDVVAVLFGSASDGGAYDGGLSGAYGRAATWRSLTALAGGSHVGCAWWIFYAVNDWFYDVGWDLGVVCLRPGGHVMAVLAATDTD